MNMGRNNISELSDSELNQTMSNRTRNARQLLNTSIVPSGMDQLTYTYLTETVGTIGNLPPTLSDTLTIGSVSSTNGGISLSNAVASPLYSRNTNYEDVVIRNNYSNNIQFGNDKKIEFTNDGELVFTMGERVINVNKLIDKVDKLERQMAIILDQQHKKINGKVLKSKVNL